MEEVSFFDKRRRMFLFYNPYHLGDQIFNMILFHKISDLLKRLDVKIRYSCKREYHEQVGEFIEDKERIQLVDLDNQGLELWINNPQIIKRYELQSLVGYDNYYILFFQEVLRKMCVPYLLMDLKFEDEDLLFRQKKIYEKYTEMENVEILIINSIPLSGQYRYSAEIWNRFIFYLSKKYKVITTNKVENILCTQDMQFSVKDIGSISTKMRYIIGINTGPFVGCYNVYTLQNVEKIYIFVDNLYFQHRKIEKIRDIEYLYLYF